MTRVLRQLNRAFLIAFATVALAAGYWGVAQKDELTIRQDNPRRALDEQSIRRGDILDRDGRIIATSLANPENGLYVRQYPFPEAASVSGYYSLRHGTGGVEQTMDAVLRGDRFVSAGQEIVNDLLHHSRVGGDVRLTLSLPLQQATRQRLAGHTGAIVVLNAVSGEILAMDSQPAYDPNTLDDHYEDLSVNPQSPLLNRAIQSLYQPGGLLQVIVLGEALNRGEVSLDEEDIEYGSVVVGVTILPCALETPRGALSVSEAFRRACPSAFQQIGSRLGSDALQMSFSDFGLGETVGFDLPVAARSQGAISVKDAKMAAIGQETLTVTPLEAALVAAAFANHGGMPAPRLIEAIRAPGGDWQAVLAQSTPRGTISRAHADAIAELMRQAVISGAAQAAYSPNQVTYGHVSLALTGPAQFNTWFIGFTVDSHHQPIAIAVLLENSRDVDAASAIGGALLTIAAQLPK